MKEFLDELKNIHRRFSKFEFAIVLVFVLLVLLIPSKPDIIGFSDVQVHRQNIALTVDQSKSFSILPNGPVSITSLSVSGEVLGPGAVNVYLVNDQGAKLRVFSNEKKNRNLITGFFGDEIIAGSQNSISSSDPVLEIKESAVLDGFESIDSSSPGAFSFACQDSCDLKNSDSSSYELVAYVEPGTTLIINELDYTTRKK